MTDEPELPFDGLDAERPLPPELRARLEAALLAAVAGGLPVPADAESLDAPRPLPEPVRARLEAALLAEAAAMPSATAAAGEPAVVALDGRRRRKVAAAWSAVAAVLLMVVAVAGLAGRGGDTDAGNVEVAGGPTTTTAVPPALPPDAGVSPPTTGPAPAAPAGTATTRATRPPRPSPSTTTPAPAPTTTVPPASPTTLPPPSPAGGGESPPAPASSDPGPPPPFYDSAPPGGEPAAMSGSPAPSSPAPGTGSGSQDAAPPSQTQKSGEPTAGAPPLRVGVIGGDDRQAAGFGAYISRLNQSGGVGGRPIELVTVGPNSPRRDTVATVNLSSRPVAGPGGAPAWVTGPLLETLTAPADVLPGDGAVFSFASPPERQGRLAAAALFPSAVTGQTAVVYAAPAGSGPLADVVPAAMRAVLEQRGVDVRIVEFDPTQRPAKFDADADTALLSLDPDAVRVWVAEAKAAGYRPAGGVAGIYSLFDEGLLPDLPEGALVVSPYVAPAGAEGEAIRSGAGGTSASVLHGWATAKSLAAAIWRTGADTPAELRAALEGLAGWSSGLAPPYETRPGTRARTPEGVVFRVQSGRFAADGGFRRDP